MVVPRIPYTVPFPSPSAVPPTATTLPTAILAITHFLRSHPRTLLLTGAGISVASGLADYRGEKGTYRLNRAYRPVFYTEFAGRHESRQRYWARSFMGWPTMEKARPNRAHLAVGKLWEMGMLSGVVTQNVDSLHIHTPPRPPTTELHGKLRTVFCLSCGREHSRQHFQRTLASLNPKWADFLRTAMEAGVFERTTAEKGIKTNPDGDVDLPGAPYNEFRYPPCPTCREEGGVDVDNDGAHVPRTSGTTKGILKPAVTFFGEAVEIGAKRTAEEWVEDAGAVLVVGSSLATYSAWRLVRKAAEEGKGIGVVNLGGVRGEDAFFTKGLHSRVRVEFPAAEVLEGVLEQLGGRVGETEETVATWAAGSGLH